MTTKILPVFRPVQGMKKTNFVWIEDNVSILSFLLNLAKNSNENNSQRTHGVFSTTGFSCNSKTDGRQYLREEKAIVVYNAIFFAIPWTSCVQRRAMMGVRKTIIVGRMRKRKRLADEMIQKAPYARNVFQRANRINDAIVGKSTKSARCKVLGWTFSHE